MFVRALSERACLRGLVGVRTLCVYLDLPLDASLPFWLHHDLGMRTSFFFKIKFLMAMYSQNVMLKI